MKSLYTILIFAAVVLAQLFVPAKMIFDQETVIKNGNAFKFKTQPVDPSDPFKGKYIFLDYEQTTVRSADDSWQFQEKVYLEITTDSLGFAMVNDASREHGKFGDFVMATVNWYDHEEKILHFTLPFNEFYMNEYKAYDAEIAHRAAHRDSLPNNTYALVYVLNGKAVLDNVFINDLPIAKYIEKDR